MNPLDEAPQPISADAHRTPSVSVVIPFYNEEENAGLMVDAVHEALAGASWPWELVVVDDGSADATLDRLRERGRHHGNHVRVLEMARNFGQTAAMQAGIEAARGDVIVTLDGDMQNDPGDIPRMVDKLWQEDLDLVVGWRRARKDPFISRRLPSLVANRLIGRVTGVRLHDYGCSLKVYRAEVLRHVTLYGEMHRFIPAWFGTVASPRRIAEVEVNHRPRLLGQSKYGISRIGRVVLDLLSVYFFQRFKARPGHFFGAIGLPMGAFGMLGLGWLAFVKFGLGEDIGTRPLLTVSVLLVLASLQMLTAGVVAEMIARIYLSGEHAQAYVLRRPQEAERAEADGWRR
ncbi:MAG: glycosyltransferase family 2 protein [Gammaproteobacteria bacterium]|nr:glycosyltransferase family 2 protein [Gammaproteobacteria bacterium]MBU1414432.1 glycosyltransferase family 2 protein [Gammaproteobacteria bacterium]